MKLTSKPSHPFVHDYERYEAYNSDDYAEQNYQCDIWTCTNNYRKRTNKNNSDTIHRATPMKYAGNKNDCHTNDNYHKTQ